MGALKSKLKRSKSKQRKGPVNLPDSSSARKTVDPRLPFDNYRQVFSIKNAWKAVMRSVEETSKEHLLKFLTRFPHYKQAFPNLNNIKTEEEMKESMEFELDADSVFQLFDEVIVNLENVDNALAEIRSVASATTAAAGIGVSTKMVKDMRETFMETLRNHLGERLTETSENNFNLLYDFIVTEMEKSCL